jgi:NAD(P)H-dependent FMN reductase
MPKLLTVIASTRPGRVGLPVAQWFHERAAEHGGFELQMVDLAEFRLPLLDEPHHPRLQKYTKDHTREWSAIVGAADAFVFVTAEYNHGYPAPLKNAIDYLHHEWSHKPLGFVSYGGVGAGTRAVQQLKPVMLSVRCLPIVPAVYIPFVAEKVSDGVLHDNDVMRQAVVEMLDELSAIQAALKGLRSAD